MNEEYDYMEGFEDLEYVEPEVEGEWYISIDTRKLSEEQLEFLKKTLPFSEGVGDVDFEVDFYLTRSCPDQKQGWFTYETLDSNDKEISFNDIFNTRKNKWDNLHQSISQQH